MSIDISQFHQVFFEESLEGLDDMENVLLAIDVDNPDMEDINTIFRAAHSIKGGSATFDFTRIASFTHVLETLLDEVRDGKRTMQAEFVDLLLKSVDCMRSMLSSYQDKEKVDDSFGADLQQQFEKLLTTDGGAPSGKTSDESSDDNTPVSCVWHIKFAPHIHMLQTGNEPLRIFRELESLGNLKVKSNIEKVPLLETLVTDECFMSWELELSGEIKKEDILEVFEWVEDDCDFELAQEEEAGAKDVTEDKKTADAVDETAEKPKAPAASKQKSSDKAPPQKAAQASTSIRVDVDKIDRLINMVGELVITQSMLSQVGNNFSIDKLDNLTDGLVQLEHNTRELQEDVMRIRMLPISFAFNRFPRMIRDMSSKLGKKIRLEIFGEQTELDKTVMEKIGDPLVHLVRNSIDHGIESPEARVEAGKPAEGVVTLKAFHQGSYIVIEIIDDGAGIDRDVIYNKAIEKGIISEDADLSDKEVYDLIFAAGFSTAAVVSDISGRGVGMDVVKRNIYALGGQIEIETVKGNGSTFRIRLPLTLAILDGQLIRVGGETYIVPLASIVESLLIKEDMVKSVGHEFDLFKLRDDYVPIICLYNVFDIEPDSRKIIDGILVVVEVEGVRIGIVVDELLAQQQVVIKSLEENYLRVDGISGATILGDGQVSLIMDVVGIIKMNSEHLQQSKQLAEKSRKELVNE